MNNHQLQAIARGAVSVAAGGAIFYAAGRWLGWWFVGAFAIAAIADFAWCMIRLPERWRPL